LIQCTLQGTTVRVELGDGTTVAKAGDAHIIARAFPHTLGQPLAHFLRATAKVADAQIITEHPVKRCACICIFKISGISCSVVLLLVRASCFLL